MSLASLASIPAFEFSSDPDEADDQAKTIARLVATNGAGEIISLEIADGASVLDAIHRERRWRSRRIAGSVSSVPVRIFWPRFTRNLAGWLMTIEYGSPSEQEAAFVSGTIGERWDW